MVQKAALTRATAAVIEMVLNRVPAGYVYWDGLRELRGKTRAPAC